MVVWVLTKGGYQLGKGLGPHLSGIAAPISIQENPGKAEHGYQGGNNEGQSHRRPLHGWVYATEKEPTNWTVEALPDQYFLKITNKEFLQDGNTILMCEDPSQFDKPIEDERAEAKALIEME
ncbi:hypothetical protein CR513_01443, partial [Mucuna pruriens]